MTPHGTLFEYRAWPSASMPHAETLHHLFGLGVAEIRTDTYVVSPNRPTWLIVLRGGTHLEIRAKTSVREPLTGWTMVMQSRFPLNRGVVHALQEAFPTAALPNRIGAPADLLSWLGRNASIFTVSKRLVAFERGNCTAELTQLETHGCRAETFCLQARRLEPIMQTLDMLPGPRLPNLDYGAWLQRQVLGIAPAPVMETERKAERAASWREALLTGPVVLKFPVAAVRR